MALIAAHLNAGRSGGDSVVIGISILSLFPHLHTPFPSFSPSLISLMVSVDVKHHVYLLTELRRCVKVEMAVPNCPYGLYRRKATLNLRRIRRKLTCRRDLSRPRIANQHVLHTRHAALSTASIIRQFRLFSFFL